MSKKKNQKPPKNKLLHKKKPTAKHRNNKETSKKVFEDSFLGKSIELAPSAYAVYQEQEEKASRNEIVLREAKPAILKNKKAKTLTLKPDASVISEIPKDQKIKEVIESLAIDGKKEVVKEIFKQINEEKESFDAKLKDEQGLIFEEKKPNENLFEQIYTKEFADSARNKPKSFVGTLVDILTSDTVWFSIALALVLGVILFFFQGLQPAILDTYTISSKAQSTDLGSKYSTQVAGYFQTQVKVLDGYTYSPGSLCSQLQTFDTTNALVDEVSKTQLALFSDPKLKKLDNASYFYLQEIRDEYSRLYLKYQSKLDKYISSVQDLKDYARFLEYRNSWIRNCAAVETSDEQLDRIKLACTDLKIITEQFLSQKEPQFWSDEVVKNVDPVLQSCSNLNESNKNQFLKTFFSSVDGVLFFRPDFTALNQELTTLNSAFILEDVANFKKKVDSIENDKNTLTGMWYFLDFEL